jgi:hypothetical protein
METKTVEDALKCADACRPTLDKATGPMFGKALVILADEVLRLRRPEPPRRDAEQMYTLEEISKAMKWAGLGGLAYPVLSRLASLTPAKGKD